MKSQQLKLFAALIILAIAGFLIARYLMTPAEGVQDMSRLAHFKCLNQECGNVFTITFAEVARYQKQGGPPACPKCSQQLSRRGFKCPGCKEFLDPVGHGNRPETCPKCGAQVAGVDDEP